MATSAYQSKWTGVWGTRVLTSGPKTTQQTQWGIQKNGEQLDNRNYSPEVIYCDSGQNFDSGDNKFQPAEKKSKTGVKKKKYERMVRLVTSGDFSF